MTGDRGHRRFRNVLIVGQFALAMVLLAGAALFVRGFHEINTRQHGWQSAHLVNGSVVLPANTYPGDAQITEFQRRALERIEALPGVASASLSYSMPFFGLSEPRRYLVAGRDNAIGTNLERFMAQRMGSRTSEIRSSHVPFVSHPNKVAELIEEAASLR